MLYSEDDSGGGLRLQIDGNFSPEDSQPRTGALISSRSSFPDDIAILVGTTAEGKFVSLIDCRATKIRGFPGFTRSSQVFRPRIIAYDVHFTSVDDFRLASLSGRYSNLDLWVNTPGVSIDHSIDPYRITITYAVPETVKAALSNGMSVELEFHVQPPTRDDVKIVQRSWISICSSEQLPHDELHRVLAMVADLVSLGVGQAVRLTDVRGTAIDSESAAASPNLIELYLRYNSAPVAPLRDGIDPSQILFTLSDIRENFTSVLEKWIVQSPAIKPLYNLYFSTLRSPEMYLEHRFLSLFQALESFDRRSHQEDRRRPKATDRIRRVVEKCNAAWIFIDANKDIELAGDLRNYYTHYDVRIEGRLPSPEAILIKTHNLAVRFQALCQLVLLMEVGFSPEQLRKRIQESRLLEQKLAVETNARAEN